MWSTVPIALLKRLLQAQRVQPSLLSRHRASLFRDPGDVRSRDLVEGGHVQAETSGEAGLFRRSERRRRLGHALSKAVLVDFVDQGLSVGDGQLLGDPLLDLLLLGLHVRGGLSVSG